MGSASRQVTSSEAATAVMTRSHHAAATRSVVRSRHAPAWWRAAITASTCCMGTAASGDDPFSQARMVFSATPQAVANLAWLTRAEQRAERSTAPAGELVLAVAWSVGVALRSSWQVVFVTRLLRPEEVARCLQRFLLPVIVNPSGLALNVPVGPADIQPGDCSRRGVGPGLRLGAEEAPALVPAYAHPGAAPACLTRAIRRVHLPR